MDGRGIHTNSLSKMKILFVIPARSGSVRLKQKNIRAFLGKELFLHTIHFTQISSAQLTDHSCSICVSTDDPYILDYSKKLPNIDFLPRSKSLSTSNASLEDVCDSILSFYASQKTYFDIVFLLQVTSPLREKNLLINGMKCLLANEHSNGVIELEEHKQHLGNVIDNTWQPFSSSQIQSQELPSLYKPSGRLFIYKVCPQNLILRDNLSSLIINPEYVNNIDTLDDFILAELKARQFSEFNYLF